MNASTPSRSKQHSRWFTIAWLIPAAVVTLAAVVLLAQWMRSVPGIQSFLADYPGEAALPAEAPVGLPAWLGWQHFLSSFLLILIIRTGWLVRTTQRPSTHWTRHNRGLLRTKKPPKKISLDLWLHLCLDVLWVLNGVVFIVLLFVTGQWVRIVPTTWEVIPNALSAALQYASLDWPTEDGWVNYNGLQVLSYFAVVFLAAPLSIATGLRMSGTWPQDARRINAIYSMELARRIHFPVMVFFVGFIIVHVTLVFATGTLRNLNHMYAANNGDSWRGFWFFAASVAIMIAAWFLARPLFLRPIASLTGTVSR